MTAPALLLLTVAIVCSKATELADHGKNNKTIDNDTQTNNNSISDKVATSLMSLDRSNLRIFNREEINGEAKRRVKREEDECAAFKYVNNQDSIFHPHNQSNPNRSNYSRDVNCITIINGPEGTVIEITFIDVFHIENHPNCDYDFLEIRDGDCGYSPLLGGGKLCGMRFPPPLETTGPYAWLKFHSDSTIESEGFHIKIAMKQDPKSYVVPESCHINVGGTSGVLDFKNIDKKCKDDSENHALDVLWTIKVEENYKIYLNFTKFELAEPNVCKENVVQVFASTLEYEAKLARFCGSIAYSVTTIFDDDNIPPDDGNVMNVRVFASKAVKDNTNVIAIYNTFRTLDGADENDKCTEEEFNCQDSTCISSTLQCDGYAHCRLKTDEDFDLCKGEAQSIISESRILVVFSLILFSLIFVCLFKCISKIYHDQKIITEHLRESREDGLDSLADRRSVLDFKIDSDPRESLERECRANEMVKQQKLFAKFKSNTDLDFQRSHLDIQDEVWREDSVPIRTVKHNDRTKQNDTSRKEEYIRRKKDIDERRENRDRNTPVEADTKEFGCQTRDSLFLTNRLRNSNGSSSNGQCLSIAKNSGVTNENISLGATIATPTPPPRMAASEITIDLNPVTSQEPVKSSKKISDRRPISAETTKSAPDVIIVAKPIY